MARINGNELGEYLQIIYNRKGEKIKLEVKNKAKEAGKGCVCVCTIKSNMHHNVEITHCVVVCC